MERIKTSLKGRMKSLVEQPTGLDDIEVDSLAISTELQSWEAVQIPDRLRFSARLAIKLLLLFTLVIAFIPWTQTITATGQLSAYTPYERPQDIEAFLNLFVKRTPAPPGSASDSSSIQPTRRKSPSFSTPVESSDPILRGD